MRTRDDALRPAGPAPAAADDVVRWREIVHVAVEAADVAVWELDVAERRLRGSPNLYRLFGLDDVPAAWTVADLEQQVFVDDLPLLRDAIARAADTGELQCELRVRRKEGRIGWVLLRGRAIGQANGGPSRLAGVAQDVSQRRSSEAFLGDREAQFSAMFDITSVGMAQADPLSGRLLRVNSRLCAMLNLHAHELVGRRWAMVTHPDDRPSLAASFQQLMHGHIPTFEVEKRLLRKGGGEVWVLMTVNLIRDNAGQPQRTVAVVLDVTERKLAEQALREREDELRQARDDLEERVEERTAELAEANTALVVEIAERRLAEQHVRELLGRQADAVENERRRISRELHDTLGQHLAVLAIELNSIADRDSLPVSPRIAKIRRAVGLIEDELDRLSFELRPRALDELGLEEALRSHVEAWGAESGPHIELHSHRLRGQRFAPQVETTVYRVVQEALTNVRKHAQATNVGVIVERRDNELRVVIEDDGLGFDPTVGSGPDGGRRLGLRGMNERALLVGGRLEIESVPGRGTTVYLAIPVGTENESAAGS